MNKDKIFEHLEAIADLLNELPEEQANDEVTNSGKPVVMASDKQKSYMKKLKIDFTEPITMLQASKLISAKTGK